MSNIKKIFCPIQKDLQMTRRDEENSQGTEERAASGVIKSYCLWNGSCRWKGTVSPRESGLNPCLDQMFEIILLLQSQRSLYFPLFSTHIINPREIKTHERQARRTDNCLEPLSHPILAENMSCMNTTHRGEWRRFNSNIRLWL